MGSHPLASAIMKKAEEANISFIGDNKGTANAIGGHIGVSDIQAELMRQGKLDYIKQLRSKYQRNHGWRWCQ